MRTVKDFMKAWKAEAKVKSIVLYKIKYEKNDYDDSDTTVYVCTNCPGQMIGLHGALAYKYKVLLDAHLKRKCYIHFIETDGIV